MNATRDEILNASGDGDYATAARLAGFVVQRQPQDGRLWELLGLSRFALEQYSGCVSALERASLLVPLQPAARIVLAQAYGKVGRVRLSADLLAQLLAHAELDVDQWLRVADGFHSLGDVERAMEACRRAIQVDPFSSRPYYDLGYYAAVAGRSPQLSESLARRAIALDPHNVCYRTGLALLLVKWGRYTDAYALARRLSVDEIRRVTCENCLGRIADLFDQFRDHRRAVVCRERLLSFQTRGTPSQSAQGANQ